MNWRNWREQLIGAPSGGGLVLTRSRIKAAYAIAIAADAVQFALGPFGWAFFDEILDVIAMIATARLLGFHPLLLPTFLLELLPIVDVLPTWTGCVALVVATRRKEPGPIAADDKAAPPRHDEHSVIIDVKPTNVR